MNGNAKMLPLDYLIKNNFLIPFSLNCNKEDKTNAKREIYKITKRIEEYAYDYTVVKFDKFYIDVEDFMIVMFKVLIELNYPEL